MLLLSNYSDLAYLVCCWRNCTAIVLNIDYITMIIRYYSKIKQMSLTHSLNPLCAEGLRRQQGNASGFCRQLYGVQFQGVNPLDLSSLSMVRLKVSLGPPLFLFPWGVYLSAVLVINSWGILQTWPSHLQRLILCDFVSSCSIQQFLIPDWVGPEYIWDSPKAFCLKYI